MLSAPDPKGHAEDAFGVSIDSATGVLTVLSGTQTGSVEVTASKGTI